MKFNIINTKGKLSSLPIAAAHGIARPKAITGKQCRLQPTTTPFLPSLHRPVSLRHHTTSPLSATAITAQEPFDPQIAVVLGTQWGDEGKGKLVDILAQQYDVVARAQGGANAGHTIYDNEGNKYKLHLIPSGILNPKAICVVGNGVVIHLPGLFEEIRGLEARGVSAKGRLMISDRAHLLFELHKEIDGLREAELAGDGKSIGTTKRGIGPAYASKATRNGVRVGDLKDPKTFAEKLRKLALDGERRFADFNYDVDEEIERYKEIAATVAPYVGDTVFQINEWADSGKRILIEGANATMLDIDFGTYPYVTSSNPSIGGVISGLGLAPNRLGAVIGVAKAYTTRVGEGPYPTEVFGELAEELREVGAEYGTTTGRPRRIGWLDMVALKYTSRINGLTHVNLTKLDVLSGLEEIKVGVAYKTPSGDILQTVPSDLSLLEQCEVVYETLPGWKEDISKVRSWEEMPAAAKSYVSYVEKAMGVHCKWIGVGPGRDALVVKPKEAALKVGV
jgi:adenylosuccinate synthase